MYRSSLSRSMGRLSLAIAVAAISMSAAAVQPTNSTPKVSDTNGVTLSCPVLKKRHCSIPYINKNTTVSSVDELFLDPQDQEDLEGDIETFIKFKKRYT